jgi:hypothetical protein
MRSAKLLWISTRLFGRRTRAISVAAAIRSRRWCSDRNSNTAIRLGIDAISGEAFGRIADCLAEGGVAVNYGGLSGEDPKVSRVMRRGRLTPVEG